MDSNIESYLNTLDVSYETDNPSNEKIIKYAVVEKEKIYDVIKNLKENFKYDHLAFITAVEQKNFMEVIYCLYSYEKKENLFLKVKLPFENLEIQSISDIYNSADWHERETYDLFGIKFNGHKNLRRILLPETFEGHPLRKNYKLDYEQELIFDKEQELTENHLNPADIQNNYETKILHLNMGPHHPSTHGVLRLRLLIDGEKIVKVYPVLGYLHRGIEKICENLNYNQIVPYFDRLDYVAAVLNEFPYVLAVEKLMNLEVPKKAQYIRVLMAELSRIASHLIWIATWPMDLGATTPFFYAFREREKILEIFEKIARGRLMLNYFKIGGVKRDISEKALDKIYEFVDLMPERLKEYHELLTGNEILIGRAKGIGILKKEDAINFGVTGPMLRASGVEYDIRKAEPYSSYDEFKFDIPVVNGKNSGDNMARYIVRMREIEESIKIIKQAADKIKDLKEEISAKVPALIVPPKGSAYAKVEHAKGEMGVFIVSDGTMKPYRLKIRSPSFCNLSVISKICENNYVADVVAIAGTIDPVMGCVDR
ncbi:MAG: NADH-quinone oxidoreductase subunit D [Candidatus Altarchaeaceae archaeon]